MLILLVESSKLFLLGKRDFRYWIYEIWYMGNRILAYGIIGNGFWDISSPDFDLNPFWIWMGLLVYKSIFKLLGSQYIFLDPLYYIPSSMSTDAVILWNWIGIGYIYICCIWSPSSEQYLTYYCFRISPTTYAKMSAKLYCFLVRRVLS